MFLCPNGRVPVLASFSMVELFLLLIFVIFPLTRYFFVYWLGHSLGDMTAIVSGGVLFGLRVFFVEGIDEIFAVVEIQVVLAVELGEVVLHAMTSDGN